MVINLLLTRFRGQEDREVAKDEFLEASLDVP